MVSRDNLSDHFGTLFPLLIAYHVVVVAHSVLYSTKKSLRRLSVPQKVTDSVLVSACLAAADLAAAAAGGDSGYSWFSAVYSGVFVAVGVVFHVLVPYRRHRWLVPAPSGTASPRWLRLVPHAWLAVCGVHAAGVVLHVWASVVADGDGAVAQVVLAAVIAVLLAGYLAVSMRGLYVRFQLFCLCVRVATVAVLTACVCVCVCVCLPRCHVVTLSRCHSVVVFVGSFAPKERAWYPQTGAVPHIATRFAPPHPSAPTISTYITMRDGVRLAVDVYLPVPADGGASPLSTPRPVCCTCKVPGPVADPRPAPHVCLPLSVSVVLFLSFCLCHSASAILPLPLCPSEPYALQPQLGRRPGIAVYHSGAPAERAHPAVHQHVGAAWVRRRGGGRAWHRRVGRLPSHRLVPSGGG